MRLPRLNSLRQKIFASFFTILLLFLVLIFPVVASSVQKIVLKSMSNRADELIETLKEAHDNNDLIVSLKDQKHLLFYRIGIIDNKNRLIYDSHTKRLLGAFQFPIENAHHPEVQEAREKGVGYSEDYSQLLGQKLNYIAKVFDFHGKPYVIRLAFPHQYIHDLRKNIEIGFIIFSSIILILFTAMATLILNHLTTPIGQIIDAIKPYREGRQETIGEIRLKTGPKDDVTELANTLNSLSEHIKRQIYTLKSERDDKAAILESLTEGVIAVDNEMSISYANLLALDFLGIERALVNGQFPKERHPKLFDLLKKAFQGALANDDYEVVIEGKKLNLNVLAAPRSSSRGAILLLQDRSIHYKVLEMRKEFIANASHELKTPITIIRGFAETLQDNPDLSRDIIIDITDKVVRNCERMTKIIKNLLTLADIEKLPSYRLRHTNLIGLIEECRQNIAAAHPNCKISLQYNPHEKYSLVCDSELLEVAITNLLDNAAKYSKERPEIDVSVAKLAGAIQISVKDNGIGIPREDLEKVFQRFYTVNKAESKRRGGSGLGLSIVQTIVEKHMGTISCDSQLGMGSTFTMTISDSLEMGDYL